MGWISDFASGRTWNEDAGLELKPNFQREVKQFHIYRDGERIVWFEAQVIESRDLTVEERTENPDHTRYLKWGVCNDWGEDRDVRRAMIADALKSYEFSSGVSRIRNGIAEHAKVDITFDVPTEKVYRNW